MSLIRNKQAVLSAIRKTKENQLVALKPCYFQTPSRFLEKGLGSIGDGIYIHGVNALICENNYTVSNILALIKINPSRISIDKVGGIDYHSFHFEAGQIMIDNMTVVKRDIIIFNLLDEIILQGKVPWYLDYTDLGRMFDLASKYAGSNIGDSSEIIEFIIALISRTKDDRKIYYRTSLNTLEDLKNKPSYIPLKNVFYSATNTLNKLAGNYFANGVVSALVSPSEELERIETLLRA